MISSLFFPGTVKAVIGLGITSTIGYGTLFYSFSLMSTAIEQSLGWGKGFIFGVFSLGLLCGGLLAPIVGRLLDRIGARLPMVAGSLLVTLGLGLMSQVETKAAFVLVVIFLESVAILVLYEAAFVALTQIAGQGARLPMAQITLMAGFASTLFWPLIGWLLDWLDWRQVYLCLAALHLLLCLPLHWLILPVRYQQNEHSPNRSYSVHKSTHQNTLTHQPGKWLLAITLAVGAYGITALQIHLFILLASMGVSSLQATAAAVLIGPAQVVARLIDIFLGRFYSPLGLGVFSMATMLLGVVCLFAADISPVMLPLFALLFGVGQGLTYIVRGALPLFLYGSDGYGTLTGQLNGIRMVFTAIAPLSFAIVLETMGHLVALWLLITALCIGILSLFWLGLSQSRDRRIA